MQTSDHKALDGSIWIIIRYLSSKSREMQHPTRLLKVHSPIVEQNDCDLNISQLPNRGQQHAISSTSTPASTLDSGCDVLARLKSVGQAANFDVTSFTTIAWA